MTTALLVSQAVKPDCADKIAAFVIEQARASGAESTKALLPSTDVWTVTVFLERGKHGPVLWWYVELEGEGNGVWSDPVDVVHESPLFTAGLGEYLGSSSARVFGPDRFDGLLVVHARHPDRPTTYRTGEHGVAEPEDEWKPAVILAEDGESAVPDVVFVRWRLRSGPATWFMRGFARFTNWLDNDSWLERKFTEWSEPVLEEEDMWTESYFLERGGPREVASESNHRGRGTGTAVLGVMETAEMKGVVEGFYRTNNLVARVSERVLGLVIENPAQALRYEALRTDYEPLVHAVNPERV